MTNEFTANTTELTAAVLNSATDKSPELGTSATHQENKIITFTIQFTRSGATFNFSLNVEDQLTGQEITFNGTIGDMPDADVGTKEQVANEIRRHAGGDWRIEYQGFQGMVLATNIYSSDTNIVNVQASWAGSGVIRVLFWNSAGVLQGLADGKQVGVKILLIGKTV